MHDRFNTKIANTNIFAFVADIVFKLLTRKVLFVNRKDQRSSYMVFFKEIANFMGKLQ